ncbi:MAG: hypothetical protein KY468_14145 [Armatimonadetes bacterium]|nr:hypothetical protein [Armatimonadota bacterium]
MRLTFEDHVDRNGRNIGRPIINVTLEKAGIQADTWAKIDSGAEVSLFDSEIAEEMNIVYTEGVPVPLRGIGGYDLAYAHVVTLGVASADESYALPCRVLFKENIYQNLIGLEDFFEVFRITFAKQEGYIQLDQAADPDSLF